jgi:hypothetical protein
MNNNKKTQNHAEGRGAAPDDGRNEAMRDNEPMKTSERNKPTDPVRSAQKRNDKRNRPRPLL